MIGPLYNKNIWSLKQKEKREDEMSREKRKTLKYLISRGQQEAKRRGGRILEKENFTEICNCSEWCFVSPFLQLRCSLLQFTWTWLCKSSLRSCSTAAIIFQARRRPAKLRCWFCWCCYSDDADDAGAYLKMLLISLPYLVEETLLAGLCLYGWQL